MTDEIRTLMSEYNLEKFTKTKLTYIDQDNHDWTRPSVVTRHRAKTYKISVKVCDVFSMSFLCVSFLWYVNNN